MTNRIQVNPSGYPNSVIMDLNGQPSPFVYKYLNLSGSISNVVATYAFDGTACNAGQGASYYVTWEYNTDIRSDYHTMKVTINGGDSPQVYDPVDPITGGGSQFFAAERNDYTGNPITLTINWQLIEISTGIILQSGTAAGSPSSAIFTYSTNCAV